MLIVLNALLIKVAFYITLKKLLKNSRIKGLIASLIRNHIEVKAQIYLYQNKLINKLIN